MKTKLMTRQVKDKYATNGHKTEVVGLELRVVKPPKTSNGKYDDVYGQQKLLAKLAEAFQQSFVTLHIDKQRHVTLTRWV